MKKLIIALVAGFMLSFVGTAAHAYQPTIDTDTTAKTKGKIKPGKKKRIIVKPRVQGDTGACTGNLVITYKGADRSVLRKRTKPVGNRVPFNGRVPKKTDKITVLYQRGKKDPCDKSKYVINL